MKATLKIENITIDELMNFDKFMSFPMILFNQKEVFYANESFISLCTKMKIPPVEGNFNAFIHHPQILEAVQTALRTHEEFGMEIEFHCMDQSKCWLEMGGKTVNFKGENAILASLSDITEQKKVEDDLSRISKLRMLMLEVTQSVLQIEDIDHLFKLILDNALKALTNGLLGSILIKENEHLYISSYVGYDDHIKGFTLPIEEAFLYRATQGKMNSIANIPDLEALDKYYLHQTVFGEDVYIKSSITAPIYYKGVLFGIISIDAIKTNAFDEDDERSMEFIRNSIEIALSNHLSYQEKAFMARYDRLTNLYNRAYFEEQFALVKELAERYDDTFNLMMFDMDNLKRINDTFGHLVGDKAIQSVARELESNTRTSDFIARLGGDEFVGIFYHTDHKQLEEKFDKLLDDLKANPLMVGSQNISCSFSYGIADFPNDGTSMEELLKVADDRMYSYKGHAKKEQD